MHEAELRVDGEKLSSWKSVGVTRTVSGLADKFHLVQAEPQNRLPGVGAVALPLDQLAALQGTIRVVRPGPAVEVRLDGDKVLTGYVDRIEPSYDTRQHAVAVDGRSKTGDLVDCSAIWKTGEWKEVGIVPIVRDLIQPFGLQVSSQAATGGAFKTFALQDSETVAEAIDRACRMRRLIPTTDVDGNVVLTTTAAAKRVRTPLVRGENILSARAVVDHTQRFRDYTVKGQQRADGLGLATADAVKSKGTAADAFVDRYRPLVVLAEAEADRAAMQERAEWERNVRAGRAAQFLVTVQGWAHDDGLWEPNTTVHLDDDFLDVDEELAIVTVESRQDIEEGTTTVLTLMRPEALSPERLPEQKETSWF